MKLHTFVIPPHAEKTRLASYARRMLPQVPEYALREAFQKRDVKVNGQRVGLDALVVPGAEVKIYTRDLEEKQRKIDVLYEDENVLAAFKPAGISCEPDAKGGQTLPQMLKVQLNLSVEPLLCHRLDNPTEGLILLAKTERIQLLLQDAFRNRLIHKEYTCLVLDTPKPSHAVLEHYLIKDAKHARVRVTPHAGPTSKSIVTEYSVLAEGEKCRVRIRLHTGRTHQIRAHMAFIGHPVLGDDQYGDREANKRLKARRLMLCSTKLTFELQGELAYLNDHPLLCKPTF